MDNLELKTRRLNAGLTQKELGERIGLTESAVSLMESGKRAILKHTENKLNALKNFASPPASNF